MPMTAEGFGDFACRVRASKKGFATLTSWPTGGNSRSGVALAAGGRNRPSAVLVPVAVSWGDDQWRGVKLEDLGSTNCTSVRSRPRARGGDRASAAAIGRTGRDGRGTHARRPIPGERNWGYDGVHPYAVQNTYGGPAGLQRFIDAAHQADLAVFLDVVYNHFGPGGELRKPLWAVLHRPLPDALGKAINFDGPESDAVRRFMIDNALYWVRDFISMACGWTRSMRSTIFPPDIS